MKKVTVSGIVIGESERYVRIKIAKIQALCSECGQKNIPERPYGYLCIPRHLGPIDEIVISLEKGR